MTSTPIIDAIDKTAEAFRVANCALPVIGLRGSEIELLRLEMINGGCNISVVQHEGSTGQTWVHGCRIVER